MPATPDPASTPLPPDQPNGLPRDPVLPGSEGRVDARRSKLSDIFDDFQTVTPSKPPQVLADSLADEEARILRELGSIPDDATKNGVASRGQQPTRSPRVGGAGSDSAADLLSKPQRESAEQQRRQTIDPLASMPFEPVTVESFAGLSNSTAKLSAFENSASSDGAKGQMPSSPKKSPIPPRISTPITNASIPTIGTIPAPIVENARQLPQESENSGALRAGREVSSKQKPSAADVENSSSNDKSGQQASTANSSDYADHSPTGSDPAKWKNALYREIIGIRSGVEALVALLILVILFRSFLAGGYMIETGSMAPCLLGYHKRATCPSCEFVFAVDGTIGTGNATCPNCGLDENPIDSLLLNDGDHLLVARTAYELKQPQRWGVIVFSNPSNPREAYVKRLTGLPGERIQIRHGDVYINGKIATKDLATQRNMRILVHDHAFQPSASETDWQPRWKVEGNGTGWSERGKSFIYAPAANTKSGMGLKSSRGKPHVVSRPDDAPLTISDWIGYRHWIRRGGTHRTSVELADWPAALPPSALFETNLRYVDSNRTLVCQGALSSELRDRLAKQANSLAFREAIETLYEASHVAPIQDHYGYNHHSEKNSGNLVRDIMLQCWVALRGEPGRFAIAITDGFFSGLCEMDTSRQEIVLIDESTGEEIRRAPLPAALQEGAVVEISLWDQQLLVAIDGTLCFDPITTETGVVSERTRPIPWQPVRFGAQGLRAEVRELQLFRDVYYTANQGDRARDRPLHLADDEYFVLGDNSPVSRDSRGWDRNSVLRRELLLGKPMFVHLPSRRERIKIGTHQTEIRIPEPSRIRYIH